MTRFEQDAEQQQSTQRRVIYTVLQNWLSEDKLLQAIEAFEQHHKGQPSIAIHDYLTRIAPLFDPQTDTKQIRRNLMLLLVCGSEELAPDPLPLLKQAQSESEANLFSAQPSPQQLALHNLISDLMQGTPAKQRKVLHAELAKQLRLQFVNGSQQQLSQYLVSNNPQFLVKLTDTELRNFFSMMYVACCDILGPVKADQHLGNLLQQTRLRDPVAGDNLNRYL